MGLGCSRLAYSQAGTACTNRYRYDLRANLNKREYTED